MCLIVGEPFAGFIAEHQPRPSRRITADEAGQIRDALAGTDMTLSQGRIQFGADGQVKSILPSVVQVQLDEQCKPDTQIIYPPERAASQYQLPLAWDQRRCK